MNPSDEGGATVSGVVEHLFRHEAGRIVANLTGVFGIAHLQLAEDVVQEALVRALQTWPYRGVPDNPAAWIMRAARNLALDHVRRERRFRDKVPDIVRALNVDESASGGESGQELADDRMRMLFVCCHPSISPESQVALALKVLGGFSLAEIAAAFLSTEAAIAKRLTRARQRLHEERISFSIPEGEELSQRLNAVLHSIYLIFNEGYKASSGGSLVRTDLCQEAIRLAELLAALPATDTPRTHALLALMLLNSARFRSRMNADGGLVLLSDQDRSLWDRALISRGMWHLSLSSSGESVSEYHLQAGIAAVHGAATDYASTDWRKILGLYDRLMEMTPSPVVALNRAVAITELRGPQDGLDALVGIPDRAALEQYFPYHVVWGECCLRLARRGEAAVHFRRACELASLESERQFLRRRIEDCGEAESNRG